MNTTNDNQAQQIDCQAVENYLSEHLTGFKGPLNAEKFSNGQSNPTFVLSSPSGELVLRRKPPGKLLKSAHAVDREYRVQSALADSKVPVPRVQLLCEDESVIGSMFYIMELVQGRLLTDPQLQQCSNAERTAIFDAMNETLTNLHNVNIDSVGLTDFGPPGNYYERQLSRWSKQYRASETESIEDMDNLIQALHTSMPPDDGQRTIVHGDYRIDNMIFAADSPGIVALLDWELSTIGHPYADLGAMLMQWRMPTGTEGRGLAGVDRTALGIPTDDAFVAAYCKRRGIDRIDQLGFYLSFAFFRMGAILQGVKKRALDGNASNPERGMRLGEMVPRFASMGLAALDT